MQIEKGVSQNYANPLSNAVASLGSLYKLL